MSRADRRGEAGLVRALGVWGLAAGIVNVTVGGGIFRLPAAAATTLGTGAPFAYLACAVVMGLIVVCFAEAGSRVSLTGGPYAYVEVAFGPFVGWMAGVLLLLLGTFALAAVSTVFADSLGSLVPALAPPGPRAALLLGTFALLAAVNVAGVRQATVVNNVTTVAKLLPLFLLVLVGVFVVRPENLRLAELPAAGDVSRASIVLIFAFAGIESALVPSGEVRRPARTVPRAIFIAMAAITTLYITLQLVTQGVLGDRLATSTLPLADAAGVVLGPWGRMLLVVGATVSTFGYVCGMTLAVPRMLFALGRDGFLPAAFSAVHPRLRTPHVAIVVQTAATALLAVSGEFVRLAVLANLSALLLYAACCAATWELRRRNVRQGGTPFSLPGVAWAPPLALLVLAWLLTSVEPGEWKVVLLVLAVAAALFPLSSGRRRRLAEAAAAERAAPAEPAVDGAAQPG